MLIICVLPVCRDRQPLEQLLGGRAEPEIADRLLQDLMLLDETDLGRKLDVWEVRELRLVHPEDGRAGVALRVEQGGGALVNGRLEETDRDGPPR
jgi:hypothetical protein